MVIYLPDTSAITRAERNTAVAQRLRSITPDRLATCTPVLLELGVSARNAAEHHRAVIQPSLAARYLHLTPEVEQSAIAVQQLLAQRGQHRSAQLADLLIAAIAEHHGATVLHYDSDFDLIGEVTGQPMEWVVERGSIA